MRAAERAPHHAQREPRTPAAAQAARRLLAELAYRLLLAQRQATPRKEPASRKPTPRATGR